MEGNQKNQISTFLMVVGVIFIVVAGSIFVTTAWRYLPGSAKQVCLFLVAAGLFGGSYTVAKGGRLRKTETAFYYLGVAFTGFFTLSLFGGIGGGGMNAAKVLAASAMMLVPILMRLFLKKKGVDFGISVILADTVLVCTSKALEWKIESFILAFTCFVLILSILDYWRQNKGSEHPDLDMAAAVSYLLHGVLCLPLVGLLNMVDDATIGFTTMSVWILVAATAVTYAGRKQTDFRIMNSISIFWGIFAAVKEMNRILELHKGWLSVLFVAFVISHVVIVCMERKEMYYIQVAVGTLIPFVQALDIFCSWDGGMKWYSCLPFSITLAVACVVLWIKEKESSFLQVAGLQVAAQVVVQFFAVYTIGQDGLTFQNFDKFGVVFFLLQIFPFLVIAVEVSSKTAKRLFATFALVSGVLAMMCMSGGMIDIPWGYHTEWNCAAVGIGIVLLGRIWYDDNGIQVIQFILTCCLLAVLLLHNLISGQLGNVLILGMVSALILLVAAVHNRREYVIASSVTLILMVFYITRDFWLNIAWWVYLFVAGVILVVLAVKKEKEM